MKNNFAPYFIIIILLVIISVLLWSKPTIHDQQVQQCYERASKLPNIGSHEVTIIYASTTATGFDCYAVPFIKI